MKDSLYDIPNGCICVGDGLYGVPCNATQHATLKTTNIIAAKDAEIADARENLRKAYAHHRSQTAEIAALKNEVESLKQELGRHINRTLRDLQAITEVGH